jgi:hypothetical protein
MEKFDWQVVIGKFGDEQRALQKAQNEASTGWFVWAILTDVYLNERRIAELSTMIRSCEHMILLDEIEACMSNHFASVSIPISEQTLRSRIKTADSKDITQEIMQDAIDCALSRFKKRILQGNAIFASLEKFVASSYSPPPVVNAAAPSTTTVEPDQTRDKEEIVPTIMTSNDQEEKTEESCVIA